MLRPRDVFSCHVVSLVPGFWGCGPKWRTICPNTAQMEVLNERAAMLSNFEVYQLLQETESLRNDPKKKKLNEHQVNLSTISYEARKYLEKTPCKYQSAETIDVFLKAVAPFHLTKAETLQLLNLRPTTPVEIQLIIEESEERLKTDQEIEDLLNIINTLLPEQDENGQPEPDDAKFVEGEEMTS